MEGIQKWIVEVLKRLENDEETYSRANSRGVRIHSH